MRDIVQQFSEVTGEKAYLGLELDTTLFEATRYGDHPLAETLYLSWEFVLRSGPGSGVKVKGSRISCMNPFDPLSRAPNKRCASIQLLVLTDSG